MRLRSGHEVQSTAKLYGNGLAHREDADCSHKSGGFSSSYCSCSQGAGPPVPLIRRTPMEPTVLGNRIRPQRTSTPRSMRSTSSRSRSFVTGTFKESVCMSFVVSGRAGVVVPIQIRKTDFAHNANPVCAQHNRAERATMSSRLPCVFARSKSTVPP